MNSNKNSSNITMDWQHNEAPCVGYFDRSSSDETDMLLSPYQKKSVLVASETCWYNNNNRDYSPLTRLSAPSTASTTSTVTSYQRESSISACSSMTNTPEIEHYASFNKDCNNTFDALTDSTIYNNNKQLLIPLYLQQFETLNQHEKLLSHCYQPMTTTSISTNATLVGSGYQDDSLTSYYPSPIMSNTGANSISNLEMYAPTTINYHQKQQSHMESTDHNRPTSNNFEHYVQAYQLMDNQQQQQQQQVSSMTNNNSNFPCLIPNCHKLFSRPYNLKSHMRTHTLERPYGCTFEPCGWKFARPHDLKRHELQHTGLKPHGCRFCCRRFARSDALKRHWKVDVTCAQALKQDIALNGGKESINFKKRKTLRKK